MSFERVRRLFDAALLLPPREREAHVRSQCADDPDVLREVLDLLESDAEAPESFLTTSSEFRVPATLRRKDIADD